MADNTFLFGFVGILFIAVIILVAWMIYRWLNLKKQRELRELESGPTFATPSQPLEPAVLRKPTMRYQLENGVGYLLYDLRSDEAYKILRGYTANGFEAVIISRQAPSRIMEKYSTGANLYIWLTRSKKDSGKTSNGNGGKDIKDVIKVKPTNLGGVMGEVKDFIKAHDKPFIFIDGLEELILENEFQRVLKFSDNLEDTVALSKSKMLLALNPKGLNRSQKSSLTKRFKVIKKET